MYNLDVAFKERVIDHFIAKLERSLAAMRRELDHKVETRNKSAGAMVSRYDTFKEEAEYAANALARNVEQLLIDLQNLKAIKQNGLAAGDTVTLGSIVAVKAASEDEYYFLLPAAGGDELHPDELNGEELIAVTPLSPIGKMFTGRKKGDSLSFRGRELKISEIY